MADLAVDNLLAGLAGSRCRIPPPHSIADSMRVAVVDIGTNSTRLLLADVDAATGAVDGARAPHDRHAARPGRRRQRRARRRGDGRASSRALDELPRRDRRARRRRAHDRRAHERGARRRQRRGFTAARARRLRARRAHDPRRRGGAADLPRRDERARRATDGDTPIVVIDIGGGSTELVVGRGRTVELFESTQAGVVRHSERHITTRPARARRAAGARRRRARRSSRAALPEDVRRSACGGRRGRRHGDVGRGDRPGARALRPRARPRPRGLRSRGSAELLARLAAMTDDGAPPGPRPAPRPRADDRRRRRPARRGPARLRPRRGRGLRARHPARRGA